MSYKTIILRHRYQLAIAFENAIRDSVEWAWNHSAGIPYEPDYIASLVVNATPAFCRDLKALFAHQGISVSMASVFCHHRPKVRFAKGNCELGDVLLVHRHRQTSGKTTNQSLLLQAKMSDRPTTTISSYGDRIQLSLYTDWPHFTYVDSGPLNKTTRDVLPKTTHAGAQYLLVDNRDPTDPNSGIQGIPGTHCMAVWPAERTLHTSESLANALVELLLGRNGREFLDLSQNDVTAWSDVVWDLLKYAAVKTFTRKRVFGVNNPQSRRAGDVFFWSSVAGPDGEPADASLVSQLILGDKGGSDLPLNEFPSGDEESGVSVILIETEELQG